MHRFPDASPPPAPHPPAAARPWHAGTQQAPAQADGAAPAPSLAPDQPPRWRRLIRWIGTVPPFAWKYLAGAILCLNILTSVLVVGWTLRLMQRRVFKSWHSRSGAARAGQDFATSMATDPRTAPHRRWPNWVLRQNAWPSMLGDPSADPPSGGRLRRAAATAVHSLWLNAKIGTAAIFNIWVLTMPACVLWLFAWHAGWNNSFHKGYEQAAVGPLTGLLGIALFIAAMLYIPLAQARQAATARWRSFYDFPLVWGLLRRRPWASVGLAALYASLCLPVMLLKTAPLAFDRAPGYAQLTDAQVLEQLQAYFLIACLFVFPAYIAVRLAAARIYAGAMLAAVRSGRVPPDRLGDAERAVLDRLGLLEVAPAPRRNLLIRTAAPVWRFTGRLTAGALAIAIWFLFVAQVYISEFLNYHPVVGWLNQPLVQLPWFNYIPAALRAAAAAG